MKSLQMQVLSVIQRIPLANTLAAARLAELVLSKKSGQPLSFQLCTGVPNQQWGVLQSL